MNNCLLLKLDVSQSSQSPDDHSFVGGTPKLPKGASIPQCKLCGAEESFFFQVRLPKGSYWDGMSLAVFACTSCADEDHLIPPMLSGQLKGADIPEGFLESYQTNFRFLVFETGSAALHDEYREKVKFKRFRLDSVANPDVDDNKIGGNPNWLLEDESPKLYGGKTPMFFLIQLLQGFQFEIHTHAPRQIELSLGGSPQPSPLTYYQLFNGNKIFLFGVEDREQPLVYAITQVD
jgi:hypothetical protein